MARVSRADDGEGQEQIKDNAQSYESAEVEGAVGEGVRRVKRKTAPVITVVEEKILGYTYGYEYRTGSS